MKQTTLAQNQTMRMDNTNAAKRVKLAGTATLIAEFGLSLLLLPPEEVVPVDVLPVVPPAASSLEVQLELMAPGLTSLAWPLKSQAEAALFCEA